MNGQGEVSFNLSQSGGSFNNRAQLQLLSPNLSVSEISESQVSGFEMDDNGQVEVANLGLCNFVNFYYTDNESWGDLDGEDIETTTPAGQCSIIVSF